MERMSYNHEQAATRAAEVLRAGGVILYPTDTLYGLGADAFSDEAVARIYEIKERDTSKPIHCVVRDMAMAGEYCEVHDAVQKLAKRFFPGPLTIILKKRARVSGGIASIDTIGIRIPDHPFCRALSEAFERPFTTTSANTSGAASQRRTSDILEQLGERAHGIDLLIDAGELPERLPSTVVDLSGPDAKVLREGPIPAEEIHRILHI